MKKLIVLFLIFLCLFFNTNPSRTAFAVEASYKEGIYELADFNISEGNIYSVNNISKTEPVLVLIFDKDYTPIQQIKLEPYSLNIDTIPMKPEYLLVVTGKGEVTITPKQP
ncbi:hypothetical protein [Clostridium intestinale]|uniref:Uncharacterized protein n=1 Tax=Clostridium intestinale URNW TaxID=1294142 RepID=U2NQR5_9CLOT|nr:hypothetical protein [Clostridium intestinale]ERK31508.1 hypothetical protein CINTURNW_1155 [Clostridium intestinale URNW]